MQILEFYGIIVLQNVKRIGGTEVRVVFDADDVIFNCNGVLEELLKKRSPSYSLSQLKTYDFNKSLSDKDKLSLGISLEDKTNGLGVERSYIMDMITSTELFRREQPIGDVGVGLRDLSQKCDVSIHTSASSVDVINFKVKQINRFIEENQIEGTLVFSLTNDVRKESKCLAQNGLRSIEFTRKFGKKQVLDCDVVIEDCLENLYDLSPSTYKVLVDMPYNQEEYNPKFYDMFVSARFKRVKDVHEAIEVVNKLLTGVW